MKGAFIGILLNGLVVLSVFSQQGEEVYQKGLIAYRGYDYKEALDHFGLASNQFLENHDVEGHLKSQLYIANIQIYKNDFPSALNTIESALEDYRLRSIENDSIWGELMNAKVLVKRRNGNGKEALRISDQILDEQLKNPLLEKNNLVKTYVVRSGILINLSRYDDAVRLIDSTLKFPESVLPKLSRAALLNNMGNAYLLKEDFYKAHDYYNETYRIKLENNANLYDLAITAFNIGIIHEVLGDYDKAIEFYRKSAEYDLKNQGEEVGFIADIYMALNNVYIKKNDLDKAGEYVEKALQKSVSIFGENNINVANVHTSYAQLLKKKGKNKESLEFDKKALAIRERSHGPHNRFPIENLLSIAATYTALSDYTKAEKQYSEALRRLEIMGSEEQEASCYMGMGDMHMQMGNYKKAAADFNRAYANFSRHFGKDHRFALEAELSIAEALFKVRAYDKAMQIAQRQLRLHNKGINDYPSLIVEALHIKNRIALAHYRDTKKTDDLKKAYQALDLMIQNIQEIKEEFTSEISKINIGTRNVDYFEKAIEICHILYKDDKGGPYLEKAFRLSEINKNSTLLAGIRDEQFKKMAGVPDSLLRSENTLKRNLAAVKEGIYRESDPVKLDSLMSLRLSYSSQWDGLLLGIEKEYPRYYDLKYSGQTITVASLQEEFLNTNTTLVEYYMGAENIYVFLVDKERTDFKKLPSGPMVQSQIAVYRTGLIKRQDIEKPSKKLYDVLLRELVTKKNLIVVTDDVLNYLPFETLRNENGYLLESRSVSYAGSATLLQAQREKSRPKDNRINWSGFAPHYGDNNSLSSNFGEIENIAKLMDGVTFLGNRASLKNFLGCSGSSLILHLAAHAELDKTNSMYNALVFSPDSTDYELTAADIYTLPIPSELVVLSACDTGFGSLKKGEGIMSMARAFNYAGAKSTVMSLWKVPDKETATIMYSFYEHLKRGYSKDEALQNAKLEYLANTDDEVLKHPYFWAGFVISGNVEPLYGDISYWWWAATLPLIVLVFFGRRLVKFLK